MRRFLPTTEVAAFASGAVGSRRWPRQRVQAAWRYPAFPLRVQTSCPAPAFLANDESQRPARRGDEREFLTRVCRETVPVEPTWD